MQLEQFSQKLRAKAARADHSEEAFAATRLLAQEGLNNRRYMPTIELPVPMLQLLSAKSSDNASTCAARRFTQEVQALELRLTYEDVFQVEASTVEEYLQQVHQMTVISAIQVCHRVATLQHIKRDGFVLQILPKRSSCHQCLTAVTHNACLVRRECCKGRSLQTASLSRSCLAQDAQADTNASFEEFMAECADAEWAAAKRQLFDALLPGGAGGAAARLDGMSLSPGRPAAAFASPFGAAAAGTVYDVIKMRSCSNCPCQCQGICECL